MEKDSFGSVPDEVARKWQMLDDARQLQLKEEYIASNPNIFANPSEKDMQSNMKPFLKRLNTGSLHDIMREHGGNYKAFNGEVVQYLSSVLGLKNPPDIMYEAKRDNSMGEYSPASNTITLYCEGDRLDVATLGDIDTVAHEMWHAYQHQATSNEGGTDLKSEMYKKNFEAYVTPEEDYHGYRTQLVEAEARMFAQQFTERLTSTPERMRKRRIGRKVLAIALAAVTVIAAPFAEKRHRQEAPREAVELHTYDNGNNTNLQPHISFDNLEDEPPEESSTEDVPELK